MTKRSGAVWTALMVLGVCVGVGFSVERVNGAIQHGQHGQHGQHAQPGHGTDPAEHFQAMAEALDLSESQREKLAAPFGEAFAALQELHRLHDVIASDLTESQRTALAEMIHDMLGRAPAADGHR